MSEDSRKNDDLLNDERWHLTQRVVASSHFSRSPRLRNFLLYVSENFLRDRRADIHEQLIGSRVFGRRPDYNSSEDNIVRVEARELRKRLAKYFEAEGADEPLIITIPKGTYVPVFEPRPQAEAEPPAAAAPPTPAETPAVPAENPRLVRLLTALVVVLSITCAALLATRVGETGTFASSPAPSVCARLWTEVFDESRQTNIVVADSCFVLLQDILGRNIALDDYLKMDFRNRAVPQDGSKTAEILNLIASRQYTSLADLELVSKIVLINEGFRDRMSVRFARNLQIRDLKTQNAVLMGGNRSTPWAELFEPQLNFVFGYADRPHFRNKTPGKGELPVYWAGGADGKGTDTYGVVALLPNLSRSGNVLLLAGTTMEGTEAAGELITTQALFDKMLEKMNLGSRHGKLPYFEALLKTSTTAGASRTSELVAYRIYPR